MGRKRKQGGGGNSTPTSSTSKSPRLSPSSSSSSRSTKLDQNVTAVGDEGKKDASVITNTITRNLGGVGLEDGSSAAQRSTPVPGPGANAGISGELHPLHNPLILSNLFSFCPLKVLSSCRLVCTTWRDLSRPAWCSSAKARFAYRDQGYRGRVGGKAGKHSSLPTLTEFLQSSEAEGTAGQFQNICLEDWEFGMGGGAMKTRGQVQADQFLQLVGRSAKNLFLRTPVFADAEEFRRVIYQSFPKLQKLGLWFPTTANALAQQPENDPTHLEPVHGEHLHLKSFYIHSYASTSVPVSWAEFLSHFPALASVKLSFPPVAPFLSNFGTFQRNVGLFAEAVGMVRSDRNKLPHLSFETKPLLELPDVEVTPESFGFVSQLTVPLSAVRISLNSKLDVTERLIGFHGKYLKKIEFYLRGMSLRRASPSAFPFGVELTNLRELTICDIVGPNLQFLENTPNLKTLRIFNMHGGGYSEMVPFETGMISSTRNLGLSDMKLLTLKQLYFGYNLARNDLNSLISWFPKLEHLSAFLDNEQFAMVCDNWRDLTHLHVLGMGLSDEGVTGMGGVGQPEIEYGGTRPNVTYLKGLECFGMEQAQSELTDVAALEGFLKLPNLRQLSIPLCSHQFGSKVKRGLIKKVKECWLDDPFDNSSNELRDWCLDCARLDW